jgi:hypothetical protein
MRIGGCVASYRPATVIPRGKGGPHVQDLVLGDAGTRRSRPIRYAMSKDGVNPVVIIGASLWSVPPARPAAS